MSEEAEYRGLNLEPIELLDDKTSDNQLRKPEPISYGCCADYCSLKSFGWWLVAGKAYKK